MKKIVLILLLFLTVSINAQNVLITESGDTLITLTKPEIETINQAFLDLKYTKLELSASDSAIVHLKRSLSYSDSIINFKDNQIGILKKEIKRKNKQRIKTGVLCGGIGVILGFIFGLWL